MQGIYQDWVRAGNGRFLSRTPWIANTIVESAWPLLAGLLKGDPALSGILFFAVGDGDAAWDAGRTPASPSSSRLHNEVLRQAVPAKDMTYLDANDQPSRQPTSRIQVTANFTWPDGPQILREFGLFGGDATGARNSGYLVNYVIHPFLQLRTGSTLTRHLRLNLRSQVGPAWLELPRHWLAATSITRMDGVGQAYLAAFTREGIETIGQLAAAEPTALNITVPLMKRIELWSKARLVVRTAAALLNVPELYDRRAAVILATLPAALAAEVRIPEEVVARLREQVGLLQTALDSDYLQRITIGELAQPL